MAEKITTVACKKRIVEWIKNHPGHVSTQFEADIDERPARMVKNWKRISKERDGDLTIRGFDCAPYDDQLRAYVTSDDAAGWFVDVTIQGE